MHLFLWLPTTCIFLFLRVKQRLAPRDSTLENSNSMTLVVRGVVELFRLAKREDELHQEFLPSQFPMMTQP